MDNIAVTSFPAMAPRALPSANRLLKDALSFYAAHWHTIAGIALIPVLVNALPLLLGFGERPTGLTIAMVTVLAMVTAFLSRLAFFDLVVEEGSPSGGVIGAYQKGFRMLIPFAWVGTLATLTALGGFFLFIVPAIVLSGWLSLSPYVLFSEGKGGLSALATSWHYVRGYWMPVVWRFFFLGLIVALVGFPIGFLIGIGEFAFTGGAGEETEEEAAPSFFSDLLSAVFNHLFLIPFSIIYSFGIYRALKEVKAAIPVASDTPALRKKLLIFLVIGIVGLVVLLAVGSYLAIKFLPECLPKFLPPSEGTPSLETTASLFSPIFTFLPLLNFFGC